LTGPLFLLIVDAKENTMFEQIQFRLFMIFQMTACNPEFWMMYFVPMFMHTVIR